MDDHADFEKARKTGDWNCVPTTKKPETLRGFLESGTASSPRLRGVELVEPFSVQLSGCLSPHWTKVTLDRGCNLSCFQS